MNDLVNDLARWAAGETYFGPEDEVEAHLQPERSRHSSYTRDDYDGIKKFEAFHKAKCLRTFLPFRHGETSYVTNNVGGLLPNLKRLRRLRKLSDFAVSRKIGHGIEELMDLNSLRGTLCISRLENAVDPRRARQANLQEKQDLETLVLKWSSDITDSRDERIEKDSFPSWVGDPCFSNMVLLRLENCENCTSLPALGLLKSLKDLVITGMDALQSIGCDIYGEGCSNPFPSLETLYFKGHAWMEVSGRLPYYLPSLEELVICESRCLSVSISSFPMLRNLDVDGCKELIGRRSTIQLSSLNTVALSCISDFSFLTESFVQGLAEAKILKITGCQELTNFWQDGVRLLQHLRSLRYLKIKSCSRLVSLGPEEEGQDLKLGLPCSLEMLKLINCESLQRPLVLHGFRSLEELHIEKCAGLVFFVQTTLPCTLKKLCISYCDKFAVFAGGGKGFQHQQHISSRVLGYQELSISQEITICNCSSIVSFPEGGFPATSLKKLYIGWCEKLQALPERLRGLTSLVELDVHKCPSIVSFPRDGFPTNLTSLLITNLNFCKPLFDWGLHRLASLTRLFITAGCAHVLSFPCEETGMMLPTSLSSLSIVNFPNLQYLSSNEENSSIEEADICFLLFLYSTQYASCWKNLIIKKKFDRIIEVL
ncbi:DISEASE RESISTANCE PROTEIN RP [Salix viminalis]|uniref:DISEASE RESISTANCE PROTEIN RP n=1 Tax=Salix viminalis TaxID=40686 RepID=A0A9Q0YXY3_SALVM|nr:DISEASE RESISTANCE PROTEIN RP [Salix viminalis]